MAVIVPLHRIPTRPAVAVGLLLGTFVLATVLAFQAVAAARDHRATTAAVLTDYARAAAAEYARRVGQEFEYYGYYRTFRILERLDIGDPNHPLPSLAALREQVDAGDEELELVRYLFRMDMRHGALEFNGPMGLRPALQWLRDTLPAHVRHEFGQDWRSAVLVQGPNPARMFLYTLDRQEDNIRAAYGFEVDLVAARELFTSSAGRTPLLPPSLLRGMASDSIIAVRLEGPGGATLHRMGPVGYEESPFAAEVPGGPPLGNAVVRVSLAPDMARQLIVGRVPRTRTPLVIGLLLVTAFLIVGALLQLHREHQFQRQRSEFVANVSHELRTPLAQIRMFAETLKLGRIRSEADRQRSLDIIDQEARRLTHLVENVLQFSKSEQNIQRLSLEDTELSVLIDEVCEIDEVCDLVGPLATAKGVTLRRALTKPVHARVDRPAIRQVVLNLLDNAVKYGPEGQTISVRLCRDGTVARVEIEDEGPGIPKGERHKVWGRFERLDQGRGAAVTGTGIGLSVVRQLVELHGGTSTVEGAAGGGSKFLIELPLNETHHGDGRGAGQRAE